MCMGIVTLTWATRTNSAKKAHGKRTADGAYEGEAVYDAVTEHHPEAEVIIPPRATAVPNEPTTPTQRDRDIAEISKHGRMGWQRRSGCNRRNRAETAIYRYKTVVGRRLHDPSVAPRSGIRTCPSIVGVTDFQLLQQLRGALAFLVA